MLDYKFDCLGVLNMSQITKGSIYRPSPRIATPAFDLAGMDTYKSFQSGSTRLLLADSVRKMLPAKPASRQNVL